MAISKDVKKKVATFCQKYKIVLAALFGSAAAPRMGKPEDLDIALVPGKGKRLEKLKLLGELEKIFTLPVDLVIVSPDTDPLLAYEIFMKGKPLYENRKGLFEESRLWAWKIYMDTRRLREAETRYIRNFLKKGIRRVS